jgi:dTDP-4-dehydrorhamnose reductase
MTEYGRQKVEVEKSLLCSGESVSIIRFSKIFQPGHPLILQWAESLRGGRIVSAYADKLVSPVPLVWAIGVLVRVIRDSHCGIIHASANRDVTYLDVAKQVARLVHADEGLVRAVQVPSRELQEGSYASLDMTTLVEIDQLAPPPEEAVERALPTIFI